MSISRYHTVGAVARNLRALKELDARLEPLGVPPGSLHVLAFAVICLAVPVVRAVAVPAAVPLPRPA